MKFLRTVFLLLLGSACAMNCFAQTNSASAVSTNRQIYHVKGVVQESKADDKVVVIKHEAIPNYMDAMTMPFEVKNLADKRGLKPGDRISFDMVITPDEGWIEHIKKLPGTSPVQLPSRTAFYQVRDVELLTVGDKLPEYHFTNELGKAVSTKDFAGAPYAFTFFFTRCPYPTFCPLMSKNFEQAQKVLLAKTNAPAQWHLLSISFDGENDTPAVLKKYAGFYHYDPKHWEFLTGDLQEINAIGDQVGQYFGHDQSGSISHNLRTVVIDAKGRIQKIFPNNTWTPEELVGEMVKAATAQ